jgi:hypothetical protein
MLAVPLLCLLAIFFLAMVDVCGRAEGLGFSPVEGGAFFWRTFLRLKSWI